LNDRLEKWAFYSKYLNNVYFMLFYFLNNFIIINPHPILCTSLGHVTIKSNGRVLTIAGSIGVCIINSHKIIKFLSN